MSASSPPFTSNPYGGGGTKQQQQQQQEDVQRPSKRIRGLTATTSSSSQTSPREGGGASSSPSAWRKMNQSLYYHDGADDHKKSNKSNKSNNYKKYISASTDPKEMKIPDVLALSVQQHLDVQKAQQRLQQLRGNGPAARTKNKQEGDVAALALREEFFYGVRVGWPFPELMKPQRLMMMHITRGLQNRKHVVIESPTGTGKSAAILCSVLAWQRWHQNHTNNSNSQTVQQRSELTGDSSSSQSQQNVKIIYCR